MRAVVSLLLAGVLLGGCAGSPARPRSVAGGPRPSGAALAGPTGPSASADAAAASRPPTPTTSGSRPTPLPGRATGVPSPGSPWRLGASPLPLRPDGFGEVLPTPPQLRDRRLPTTDLLPPPDDGGFHATAGPVTPALQARMGETWSPACPVALADLRYLTVSFRGFDGRAHTGEMVVAARVASQVADVFAALFAADFPIEEMRLPTTADLTAAPTGDGNNTAAYVCRAARGQTRWSAHAYGLAIDVNPFQNPEHRRDLVLPELASAYVDRSWHRPGMFLSTGDAAVRAFTAAGWTWGGSWTTVKDPMHFSLTGD